MGLAYWGSTREKARLLSHQLCARCVRRRAGNPSVSARVATSWTSLGIRSGPAIGISDGPRREPPRGQTPPGPHAAVHRLAHGSIAAWAAPKGTRRDCFKQHRLPSKNFHLDKAREGASPLRRCLVSATAAPLRSPPHPLQTCKSNLSTISLHRRSHAERRLGSHYSVRALRSLSIPSAPEA